MLPRLYERLCQEKTPNEDQDETNSNSFIQDQNNFTSGNNNSRRLNKSSLLRNIKQVRIYSIVS